MHLGIISAIDREYELVKKHFGGIFQKKSCCGRDFLTGMASGIHITLVQSQPGKVSAALTVTALYAEFHVDKVIFVGCAGSLRPELRCGDIVVAEYAAQHDFDARPFEDECVIPSVGKRLLEADASLAEMLYQAAKRFAEEKYTKLDKAEMFKIDAPKVIKGTVCTGDLFVKSPAEIAEIRRKIPEGDVVEMEGAAVAQAAMELSLAWGIVRVVSDGGDAFDFEAFADHIVGEVSLGIILAVLEQFGCATKE